MDIDYGILIAVWHDWSSVRNNLLPSHFALHHFPNRGSSQQVCASGKQVLLVEILLLQRLFGQIFLNRTSPKRPATFALQD